MDTIASVPGQGIAPEIMSVTINAIEMLEEPWSYQSRLIYGKGQSGRIASEKSSL